MRIHVISGPEAVGPFALAPGENVVGRAPECAVALPSRRVSRRHAVLRYVGGVVWVEDAGSANGVFDGHQRRIDREALAHGATFQVGDYLLALEVPAPVQEEEVDLDEDSVPDDDEPPTNPGGLGRAASPPPRFAPALTAGDASEQSLTPALASGMARSRTLVPDDAPAPPWPAPSAPAPLPPLRPGAHGASNGWTPAPLPAGVGVGAPPAPLGGLPPLGGASTLAPAPAPAPPAFPPAFPPASLAAPAPTPVAPPAAAAPVAARSAAPRPAAPPPRVAAATDPANPLATLPWNALGGAAVGVALGFVALVACGQVFGARSALEEAALQRGEQIADVLGARNAALLADQRGLDALDVNVVTERDGVRDALLTDDRGTVLAPAKRLRTSVSSHAAWKDAARSRTYARAAKDDGTWEIVAPIRADIGNAGVKQVVGYAVLEVDPAQTVDRLYGPAGRVGVILLASLMAGGALVAAAWALVLRPLTTLRDETELALRGDSDRVHAPVRLAPLEALAHSINRVVARARARGEG